MAFISQQEINEVRNAASIVDIIASYIPLTQRGKNYFGVCPFHEDHSPSMSVSSEKQIYKCFSCGATGNVFTFIENFLNVSFSEAVSIVANKVGITLKGDIYTQKKEKFATEYEIMDFAVKFYQNNLNSFAGKKAQEYLTERGINSEATKEFDIGLALDKDGLYNILTKKGYPEKTIALLGLIHTTSENSYDVFQNRIMFPIHDFEGHPVGFTARCYLENVTPKYLNTKETYIFKKGNILYNYHRAKDQIRLQKEVVIVEGNMDAIRLSLNNIKNVVALMGTNLTQEQTNALKKLRVKIILMLDNDEAGETSTYAVGNILEEAGLTIQVVRLSGAKDPDEYILKYGADAMLQNIHNATSFMDFKLNYLKKNKNLDSSVDLADYLKSVIANLQKNNDPILKEVTLQKLSNDYNISYDLLKEQLGNEETPVVKTPPLKKTRPKLSTEQKLGNEILYCMMQEPRYIRQYKTQLGMFPLKEQRDIAGEILYYYESNQNINLADFITYAETSNLKNQIMDIINTVQIKEVNEELMNELILKLKKKIKEQEIQNLKAELKTEYDVNKKIALTEKIAEIKKEVSKDENN